MRVQYKEDYASIKKFSACELPDFTVITGLNGAGKTHLLQSIVNGKTIIDNLESFETKYFSYLDFRTTGYQSIKSQEIFNQQKKAWQFLLGKNQRPPTNWIDISKKIYLEIFGELEGDYFDAENFKRALDRIGGYSETGQQEDREYINKVDQYYGNLRKGVFQHQNFRNFGPSYGIAKAIRKIGKPLHLIDEQEFIENYTPSIGSANHLSTSLGIIFTKYKVSQFLWVHGEWEKTNQKSSREELEKQYEIDNKKPWLIVNEILDEIHLFTENESVFNFKITDPEDDKLSLNMWTEYMFEPQLIDKNDGEPRNFSQLSSGEQVLLALAISIYETQDGFELPKVLLLDEIDASLHPSMTRALLSTINRIFVENGTKVILATHSPSTVALAPEESVHVINKGNVDNKIEKQPNKLALETITEGYATLESGISIFDQISNKEICVISEGSNSDIIKMACDLYGYSHVDVIGCFKGNSGKDQLRTLYHFFSVVPHNTKVLFVWDCDVKKIPEDNNNTFALSLPENTDNKLAKSGIENIFPNHLFNGFLSTTTDSEGRESQKFDPKRKADFAEHVIKVGTKEDFQGFEVVMNKLAEIVEKEQRGKRT